MVVPGRFFKNVTSQTVQCGHILEDRMGANGLKNCLLRPPGRALAQTD